MLLLQDGQPMGATSHYPSASLCFWRAAECLPGVLDHEPGVSARVVDMTVAGPSIQRELAMIKVRGTGEPRVEALRLADAFRARVIDAGTESFIFEITGASDKIDSFIN